MSIFTYVELDYLTGERRLARIATIGAGGIELKTTKKFRDGGIHETPAIGGFVSQPVGDGFINDNSTFGGGQQICGARFGHSACAVGEDVHVALESDGFFAQPGGTWTCGFWGESVRTSILLPSGHTVSREVLATPHHDVNCGGQRM